MRECPYRDSPDGAVPPSGSVAGLSSSVAMRPTGQGRPAPAARGRGRGRVPSFGDPSHRTYALASRQDPEAPPDADAGILLASS